jgi:c-di-GMP-binding flagellar brake protein YcgR
VLRVDHVARRKPYRLKERIETDASVELTALKSSTSSLGARLVGRMLDISSSGAGLLLDQELGIGDRVQIETEMPGLHVSSQATVVQVERASFGRWRLGCQFTMLPPNQERHIDQFVAGTTGTPSAIREVQVPTSGRISTN